MQLFRASAQRNLHGRFIFGQSPTSLHIVLLLIKQFLGAPLYIYNNDRILGDGAGGYSCSGLALDRNPVISLEKSCRGRCSSHKLKWGGSYIYIYIYICIYIYIYMYTAMPILYSGQNGASKTLRKDCIINKIHQTYSK